MEAADAGAGGIPPSSDGIFSSSPEKRDGPPHSDREDVGAGGAEEEERERAALAYLLRYEAMVRQQDAEDMATSAHLAPIWARLSELGGVEVPDRAAAPQSATEDEDRTAAPRIDAALSRRAMGRALGRLEDQAAAQSGGGGVAEAMTTDLQLMFLLRTLVAEDGDDEVPGIASREKRGNDVEEKEGAGLTFAEFSYAYKLVVGGMQCLQMLPPASAQDPAPAELRGRVTDRTTAMLQSFYDDGKPVADDDEPKTDVKKSKTKSPVLGGSCSKPVKSLKADDETATTADGDDGKGGGDEMRRLLTVKDRQLVRILDDHFDEMDNVAGRIADKAQADRRRGRKRAALAVAGAAAALLLVWAGAKMSMGRDESAFTAKVGIETAEETTTQEMRVSKKAAEDVTDEFVVKHGETSNHPLKNLQNSLAELILKAQVQDAMETKEKKPAGDQDAEERDGEHERAEKMARTQETEKVRQQRFEEEDSTTQDAEERAKKQKAKDGLRAAEMKRELRSQHRAKVSAASMAKTQKVSSSTSNPRTVLINSASVDVGDVLPALPGLRRFLEVDPKLSEDVRQRKIETRRHLIAGVAGTGAALLLPVLGGVLAPLAVGLMGFGWIRTLLAKGGGGGKQ